MHFETQKANLQEAGKQPVLIPWQSYPAMQVDPAFADQLKGVGLTPTQRH